MDTYTVSLNSFSGPIEKLLALIEARELEVTEVSIAAVTGDFLKYLEEASADASQIDARLIADFVVVASRLLLIKSKALLPGLALTEEEERDIKDLESRLALYKQFKPALQLLDTRWKMRHFSVSRPLFAGTPPVFYPGNNLTRAALANAMQALCSTLEKAAPDQGVIRTSLISLEKKIEEIVARLRGAAQGSRTAMGAFARGRSRAEIVVLFLAILHLLERQVIRVEQGERFSDILIEKTS